MGSKILLQQVIISLIQRGLLWDACAVAIIGIDNHLKRAELGLYAIELVLEELPVKESTDIFSKVKELIRCTSEYIIELQDNIDAKIRASRKIYQSHMNLEDEIKKEGFSYYPLSNDIPLRMEFLILSSRRIASVALQTYHEDCTTLEAIDAAVGYLPDDKRNEVLNKIVAQGLKMLTNKK